MTVTSISVSEELRRELLKVAAELQAMRGERVGYEEAICYLISRARRDERLLREACAPTDLTPEELRREVSRARAEERKREEALEHRYA